MSKLYRDQELQEEQKNSELKNAKLVAILNFTIYPDTTQYMHHFTMNDKDELVMWGGGEEERISLVVFELEKFNMDAEKCENLVQCVLFMLKNAHKLNEAPCHPNLPDQDQEIISSAYELLHKCSWSDDERRGYERWLKVQIDNAALLNESK